MAHLIEANTKNYTTSRDVTMSYGPEAGRWRDTLLLERRSPVAGVD